jgi:hypothetical protein
MAKLKRVLEATEYNALTAAMKDAYTEKGGKYVLDTDDAEGLQSSLEAERKARKDLEAKLAGYGEMTPEQVKALSDDKTKAERDKDFAKGNFEKILAEEKAKMDKTLSMRDEGEKRMRATLESALIDAEAVRILADPRIRGNPELLLPIIKQRTQLQTVGDREVAVIIGEKGGPRLKAGAKSADEYMGLSEYVAELKADPRYKGAFESPAGSGTGGQRAVAQSQRPARQAPDMVAQGERVVAALKEGATTISD